jgi:succinyl-CoA synthetase beta subunit
LGQTLVRQASPYQNTVTHTNPLIRPCYSSTHTQALELAKQMLGQTLVTKQTGAAGKPVNTLYIARKMKLKREMYFAILLDRKTAGPIMIGCRWGKGGV